MKPSREAVRSALALEKPAEERTAFLDVMCDGDPASRARLEALLADAPGEAVGQTLGHYKLLERVGEGGCGVVYVAEQTEPVRRRVAPKVIKLGWTPSR